MAWVKTKGVANLQRQFNEAFPTRDKTSDGTVGDLAHQGGSSSHNPDKTGNPEWADGDAKDEVRAADIDRDLKHPTVSMEDVVQHLVKMGRQGDLEKVIRYIIFNRRIWRSSTGWATQEYTGSNPHDHHAHFTMAFTQAADENDTYDFQLEALLPLNSADKEWMLNNLGNVEIGSGRTLGGSVRALVEVGEQPDGSPTSLIGRNALNQGIPAGDGQPGDPKWSAWKVLSDTRRLAVDSKALAANTAGQVAELEGQIGELNNKLDEILRLMKLTEL